MKQLIQVVVRLYDLKIIVAFLVTFLVLVVASSIEPLQVLPDIFDFNEIESPESVLLTLWSVLVASSSIILTILLVVYGSFSKKIRRNSLDFVLDNPWIRIAFSLFAGSFLYLSLSFVAIGTSVSSKVTLLYSSSLISVLTILSQFPLVALSLKYSTSHRRLRKLIDSITESDVNNVVSPYNEVPANEIIEHLEQNRIIVLKDIGVNAIKEGDWGLPQTIVNALYDNLISTLNKTSSQKDVRTNLSVFCFVCDHFKNHVVVESDHVTMKVLLATLVRVHHHLASNQIRELRRNPVDTCIKDLHRLAIQNSQFYSVQPYLLRDTIRIIKGHYQSISHSDEQLPTLAYQMRMSRKGVSTPDGNRKLTNYWYYVTQELIDLLFDDLKYAIEAGNKNAYAHFGWTLNSLFDIVYDSENLTEFQRNDAFNESYFESQRICDLAMDHGIFDHIDFISEFQIAKWVAEGRENASRALWSYENLLIKLNSKHQLSHHYIDRLFWIARSLATRSMDSTAKQKAIKSIIETSFYLYEQEHTLQPTRSELVEQLTWLNEGYLNKDADLEDLRKQYSSRISRMEVGS